MKKILKFINSLLKNDDNKSIIEEENTQKEVSEMSTRDVMIFKTRAKGRYRMSKNDEVKSVSIIIKDDYIRAKVTGKISEVTYNYDMTIHDEKVF